MAVAVAALYVLPQWSEGAPSALAMDAIFLVLAGVAICAGNVLRQPLLAEGKLHKFFAIHLWVTAGLPMIFIIPLSPAIAALGLGLAFLANSWWLTRQGIHQGRRPGLSEFVKGDSGLWSFGAMQLLMGVSVAAEVAVVLAFELKFALAFVGLSRLIHAAAAVATRPLEAGLTALLRDDAVEWLRRQKEAAGLAMMLAMSLMLAGGGVLSIWLGVDRVPVSMTVLGSVSLLAIVAYRREMTVLAVAGRSKQMLCMAVIEMIVKTATVALLAHRMDSAAVLVGMSIGAAGAVVLAWGVRRKRQQVEAAEAVSSFRK